MKTILLFRHGKSDWDADYGADHDRPLAKRGKRAAASMGIALARLGQVPERVLTSSAVRARETIAVAAEAGAWDCPVDVVPELYASSPEIALARVRQEDDSAASLLLAGHEPTWSTLASELIGGGFLKFPTAALARIDVEVDRWSDVESGRGMLVWFLIPRQVQRLLDDSG